MADELSIKHWGELVNVIDQHDLSSIIKPLVKEIYLFDTFIAGTLQLKDKSPLEGIREGDKLNLQREEDKFDSNAIALFNEKGQKLGYIPEKDDMVFARLMDAGKLLVGKIAKINSMKSFKQIAIGIYLVDF